VSAGLPITARWPNQQWSRIRRAGPALRGEVYVLNRVERDEKTQPATVGQLVLFVPWFCILDFFDRQSHDEPSRAGYFYSPHFGSAVMIPEAPASFPTEKFGCRRTASHLFARTFYVSCLKITTYLGAGRCREVRGSVVLVAPQGFIPIENKRDIQILDCEYPCPYPT